MEMLLILAPLLGLGIGTAGAYGVSRGNSRIHFVEPENLNDELEDLDIEVGGEEACIVCGDSVEPADVGAVVREDGEYRVVCDKPSCLDTYDLD